MVEYTFLDRVLHRAALQFGPIAELSFDLDQTTNRFDPKEITNARHVFVSGLARAGTTVLMRRIYATGAFCSLTYRNMPFVLAPNIWGRFATASKRKDAPAERAHGDRIFVDIDSPESLDEVFWRIFCGDGYIAKTYLTPHEPDEEITEKYVAYVAAILKADGEERTRYLSKNNNNILRLGAVRRAFPEAVILVPFRNPLSHAGSLLRQHRNFVAQQQIDRFVRSYMTWLAHHEFGLDHRPFRFSKAGAERLAVHQPDQLDYWLEIWCQAYTWLQGSAPTGAIFVCYEDLCQDAHVWNHLVAICGTENRDGEHKTFIIGKTDIEVSAQTTLVEEANAIYERLVKRARAALQGNLS